MLSKESIKEYQRIYKKQFGKKISEKEASEQGARLVEFFKVLYSIDKKYKSE